MAIPTAVRAETIDRAQFRKDYKKGGARAVQEKYDIGPSSVYALLKYWHIPLNSPNMSDAARTPRKAPRALVAAQPAVSSVQVPIPIVSVESKPFIDGMILALRLVRDGMVQS